MIETVWVTNPGGETLKLNLRTSQEDEGLLIFNITGLGSPKATVNGVGGPTFDGLRVNSVVADARHLLMTLAIPPQVNEEQTKEKVYRYFPIKKEITLRIKTGFRDVYTMAHVEASEFNQFATVENVEISLLCANPYFTDMLEQELEITYDSATPQFAFPFFNEAPDPTINFGYITASGSSGLVTYDGGVETGLDIEMYIHGPITQVDIYNDALDQRLGFSTTAALAYFGAPAQSGDRVVINTRRGKKSIYYIRGGVSYNMLNSVWFADTWLTLIPGLNYITVVPVEGGDMVTTNLKYRGLREGV